MIKPQNAEIPYKSAISQDVFIAERRETAPVEQVRIRHFQLTDRFHDLFLNCRILTFVITGCSRLTTFFVNANIIVVFRDENVRYWVRGAFRLLYLGN